MSTDFNERQRIKKISKNTVAIVALIAIGIIILVFSVKVGLHYYKINKIENYAKNAGLTNVSVNVDEYDIRIRCENFKEVPWDMLMTMDRNITDTLKDLNTLYITDTFNYRILKSYNKIIATNHDTKIEYNGEWVSCKNIDLDDEKKSKEDSSKMLQESLDKMMDEAVSNSTCCICGKQATKRIDEDYYCTKHYNDAAEWYIKKAAQKLVDGQ